MFGNLGKQLANQIGDAVENAVGQHLASKNPGAGNKTEKATESLQKISAAGNRRALFIGINYKGQQGELRGCINDVHNIKNFLTTNYQINEMLILTDVSFRRNTRYCAAVVAVVAVVGFNPSPPRCSSPLMQN